jgi:hypothetical protein
MVFCVQANFAFRNASRRNQISSNIQTRIAQTTTYGPVSREDYTDVITAVGTGINGPVTGSELYRHDCPGDGEHWACEIAERVDW